MNIQSINQQTFGARNLTIRRADDIVRKVNNEFPRVSITKIESLPNAKYYLFLLRNLWIKTIDMRDSTRHDFLTLNKNNFKEKILSIINPIKDLKLGNCRESAILGLLGAKANGIKNCKIAFLKSPDGYDFDHAVVLVKDKKPYIIDAWLGFADYVPKSIERYKKEFRNCFDFEEAKTEKMIVKEDFGLIYYFLNNKTSSKKSIDEIKKICSNLII